STLILMQTQKKVPNSWEQPGTISTALLSLSLLVNFCTPPRNLALQYTGVLDWRRCRGRPPEARWWFWWGTGKGRRSLTTISLGPPRWAILLSESEGKTVPWLDGSTRDFRETKK